ncbi:MAG: 50S ribosomal protein L24 [Planctomycetaceae bacterium]|nr:50S ribosomal protein L24 [Planctomycetaceae bacterium]
MAHLHVKKGDTVRILSGNDKGKQGVVKEAFPRETRVIVEGINLRWKHKKPTAQNQKGERVQQEMSIHASNVARIDGDAKPAKKAASKTSASKASTKKGAK